MKTIVVALLAFAIVRQGLAQSTPSDSPSAVEVVVDQSSSDIFPSSWLSEKNNAAAEPLDPGLQLACLESVHKVLSLYPESLLTKNLKKVYVVGRLSYREVAAGGSNSKSSVYVVRNPRYSAEEMEKNVHAEFSSILLRNYKANFDEVAWMAVNPEGFEYRKGGVQAIKDNQASLRFVDSLHEEGFLSEYGKASVQEDFNGYAARLFMGDQRVWSAIERFPKVKAKADLTMAFFQSLDPSFTPEFFQSLRK